jgi:toxic protein SymE
MSKDRHLKIYPKYSSTPLGGGAPRPEIRLSGKWLEELGFEPGQSVTVVCEEKKLFITLNELRIIP